MEAEPLPATAPAEGGAGETLADRKKKKKKKKKRKREEEKEQRSSRPREAAQSPLEPKTPPQPPQEEDWCLGEPWTISPSPARVQPEPPKQPSPLQTPRTEQPASDTVRKKKKRRRERLGEEAVSRPVPER